MTLLAKEPSEWFTSEWIAGSINVNPVIVRKELINLKKTGLLESRKGKEGGVRISRKPEEIAISDIYNAVKNSEVLGRKISFQIRCAMWEKTSTIILNCYSMKQMIWSMIF